MANWVTPVKIIGIGCNVAGIVIAAVVGKHEMDAKVAEEVAKAVKEAVKA